VNTVTETPALRPELEALPERLSRLPIDARGYPVPWFVPWILVDGQLQPEFRAMDGRKFRQAIQDKLCWVCGEKLGRYMTFVAGPMCGVNRTSSEPPSHHECATYSARNCPFLTKPYMHRREDETTEAMENSCIQPGHSIRRNPGVVLLWTTRSYSLFRDGKGGVLLQMGDPTRVEWYAEGKPNATRAQVLRSIETGLPFLEELAREQPGAMEALHRMRDEFMKYVPAE